MDGLNRPIRPEFSEGRVFGPGDAEETA